MTAVRSCGGLPSGESTLQIIRLTAFRRVGFISLKNYGRLKALKKTSRKRVNAVGRFALANRQSTHNADDSRSQLRRIA